MKKVVENFLGKKIKYDKKIDELREKELKIIGSEREHKLSNASARIPADSFEDDLISYAKTKAGISTYRTRKIKPKMPTTINRLRGSINRINRNIKEMQDNIDKLNTYEFKKMFMQDKMYTVIKDLDSWLHTSFNALNAYTSL